MSSIRERLSTLNKSFCANGKAETVKLEITGPAFSLNYIFLLLKQRVDSFWVEA
jgi:hypothetical protein